LVHQRSAGRGEGKLSGLATKPGRERIESSARKNQKHARGDIGMTTPRTIPNRNYIPPYVVRASDPAVSATISAETNAALIVIARKRNMSKASLVRFLIEDLVRREAQA
jgi:hypothetical protein